MAEGLGWVWTDGSAIVLMYPLTTAPRVTCLRDQKEKTQIGDWVCLPLSECVAHTWGPWVPL